GRCARARAPAEHLHLVRDDLGRIAVVPVTILPFSRTQTAFDIDLRAFPQVFGRDFRQSAEHRDVVPFGPLLLLAGFLVSPRLAGRQAQVRDGAAARHVARLGIGAEVADQDDFIDASRHRSSCVAVKRTGLGAPRARRAATPGQGARSAALYMPALQNPRARFSAPLTETRKRSAAPRQPGKPGRDARPAARPSRLASFRGEGAAASGRPTLPAPTASPRRIGRVLRGGRSAAYSFRLPRIRRSQADPRCTRYESAAPARTTSR